MMSPAFLSPFDLIFVKLAGDEDRNVNSNEFEFEPDRRDY